MLKDSVKEYLSKELDCNFSLESPKDRSLAHFAMPCFSFAKELRKSPNQIAQDFANKLKNCDIFSSVEAVNAYVNFKLSNEFLDKLCKNALNNPKDFAKSPKKDYKILLEYVSANPTGPLHIGHARGAIYGDSLNRIAKHLGYTFDTEYYVNDAGNQIDLLGTSVILAIRDFVLKEKVEYPESFYGGEYMQELAFKFYEEFKNDYESKKAEIANLAKDEVLKEIKQTLANARIKIDNYVSETSYYSKLDETLNKLKNANATYEKEGKLFLASTKYGDDLDRVIVREDGRGTYLAADIVYHDDKLSRGYDKVINIWGADHHGYIARVKAAMSALGHDANNLEVILAQMVNLLKNGQPYKMSKRKGNVILFSDVLEDIGADALRYIFISKRCDSPLEFDVDEFKKQDSSNPVFYINYAHARIHQIFAKANKSFDDVVNVDLSSFNDENALNLLFDSLTLNDVLEDAFNSRTLSKVCDYLKQIASSFHKIYNETRVVGHENEEQYLKIFAQVALSIKTGFDLIGINALTRMEKE
ncbi:arginyl-tRNA synthetase [Campylobacter sp. RM5004]|uniref:arginine--tRNA ligase n=1 Tax=Campylobacter sp. RM5004 TaxID=1660078 RepID=UPI001EFBB761|nr:arginine--tRNA ligase [Campylobacter sp. RM5004]ULO01824.1 arginyl-tRNA synthetase [Campylobacter sp. RM5004]